MGSWPVVEAPAAAAALGNESRGGEAAQGGLGMDL